ncbi:MAG TPA: hypothetical protein VHO06_21100 [Polyangia bacterium]|nr:hypothetical protein [Polyangia bacterium]
MSERMNQAHVSAMSHVLDEVREERMRQHERWGEQNLPDGTRNARANRTRRGAARRACDKAAASGKLTWLDVAEEEHAEIRCEEDVDRLRAEIIQKAAVLVQWVEAIDRRRGK